MKEAKEPGNVAKRKFLHIARGDMEGGGNGGESEHFGGAPQGNLQEPQDRAGGISSQSEERKGSGQSRKKIEGPKKTGWRGRDVSGGCW